MAVLCLGLYADDCESYDDKNASEWKSDCHIAHDFSLPPDLSKPQLALFCKNYVYLFAICFS